MNNEILQFIDGDRSEFVLGALEWRLRVFLANAADGIPIVHALGFRNVYEMRLAMRDHWLRQAAKHIPEDKPWPRARRLAARINTFESACWPKWERHPMPPDGTDAINRALFNCRKIGAPLPSSVRQLYNILTAA